MTYKTIISYMKPTPQQLIRRWRVLNDNPAMNSNYGSYSMGELVRDIKQSIKEQEVNKITKLDI